MPNPASMSAAATCFASAVIASNMSRLMSAMLRFPVRLPIEHLFVFSQD
jgi:hypothetical protein